MKTIKERREKQRENINPDIEKHYTPLETVRYCLKKLKLRKNDLVLDVGSGLNMIWYNNINCKKDWVEIDKQKDFFNYNKQVDWCIGNPPFRNLWDYLEKAFKISKKGVAFLLAVDFWNRLTQKRLRIMKELGFNITEINVLEVKKWFGRYFFIKFEKNKKGVINFNIK